MSAFGEWTTAEGLPAFEYRAGPTPWDPIIDPPSTRHRVHVGNRRITLVAGSDGLASVWDEHVDCRWLAENTGICRFGSLATDAARTKVFGPARDVAVLDERNLHPPDVDEGSVHQATVVGLAASGWRRLLER